MNNKGMTIVEVLLSVVIIGIIIAFLFNLFLSVRYEDEENSNQSDFLIIQSTFIKEIEDDIIDYDIESISKCNILEYGIKDYMIHSGSSYRCVKINYLNNELKDNIGVLMIFDYNSKYADNNGSWKEDENDPSSHSWNIAYKRGYFNGTDKNQEFIVTKTVMKEFPEDIDLSYKEYDPYVNYMHYGFFFGNLVYPIADLDGNRYDIELSFSSSSSIKEENFCSGDTQTVETNDAGSFKCNHLFKPEQ